MSPFLSDLAIPHSLPRAEAVFPGNSPLQQIQQSITGPVAGFIALAAVAIAGAMLIFGGELNDFARRLCYVALVGGVLLGATQIVALFGATGASIGEGHTQAEQGTPELRIAPATAGEETHG